MKRNDILHNFKVIRVRKSDELKGTLYEMVHLGTGTELAWLDNGCDNKLFSIAFKTLPWDDTGVFHIMEHSVLAGSENFPVKEPFLDLIKSSLNTFLNAMTFPDKTVYPVSSRNDQDFMNLTEVYLDAVFKPAIYTNESIFRQEGWHYEVSDGQPVYNGVVFNEMKGAFSSVDTQIENELMRALYPDSAYRFISGGDPAAIPDLTYENFLRAHREFYSPSNARIYLDGDVPLERVLTLIDEGYLSDFGPSASEVGDGACGELSPSEVGDGEPSASEIGDGACGEPSASEVGDGAYGEPSASEAGAEAYGELSASEAGAGEPCPPAAGHEIAMQAPVKAAELTRYYEIGKDEEESKKSFLSLGKVFCDWSDRKRIMAYYLISSYLAGNNESPLRRAVLERGLAQDVEFTVMDGIAQPFYMIVFRNTDPENKDELISLYKSVLLKVIDEGIDRDILSGGLNRFEFSLRETGEPQGITRNINALNSWLYGGDMMMYLESDRLLSELREALDTDLYTDILRELTDMSSVITLLTLPSKTKGNEEAEAERKRVTSEYSSLSDDEVRAVEASFERLRKWQQSPDSEEAKATLPTLKLSDVDPKPIWVNTEVREVNGVRFLYQPLFTNGVSHVNMYFAMSDASARDIMVLSSMTEFLGSLPTTAHSAKELQKEIRNTFGSISYSISSPWIKGHNDRVKPFFTVSFSLLEDKLPEAVSLITEILTETVFDNRDIIEENLLQTKEGLYQTFMSSGNRCAVRRVLSHYTAAAAVEEKVDGFDYVLFLKDLLTDYDEKASAFISDCISLSGRLFVADRLTVGETSTESHAVLEKLSTALPSGTPSPEYMEIGCGASAAADTNAANAARTDNAAGGAGAAGADNAAGDVVAVGDVVAAGADNAAGDGDGACCAAGAADKVAGGTPAYLKMALSGESTKEAILIPAGVSYAAFGSNIQKYGYKHDGRFPVLSQLLSYGYLWGEIRIKGGAYGCGFSSGFTGNMYFASYRDPQPLNSLDVYKHAGDFIRGFAASDEDVTNYIISSIGGMDGLVNTGRRGFGQELDVMRGICYDDLFELRRQMLALKKEDLTELAQLFDEAALDGSACVIGNKDALSALDAGWKIYSL